jgi:hypothetical protein
MLGRIIIIIIFQFFLLSFFSCTERNRPDDMNFLVTDYYNKKLSLIKMNKRKIIEKKVILSLTGSDSWILRAGFLTSNTVFVAFKEEWKIDSESTFHVRTYDIINCDWSDVFTYRKGNNYIQVIDIENSGGYLSQSYKSNELMYMNFTNQTIDPLFEFSKDEKIIDINCRFSDSVISVNTYERETNTYRYYFIDKFSHKKTNEGIGKIYLNKYSDYSILENDSKIYFLDSMFNPIKKIEIPVGSKKYLSRIIIADGNNILFCFYQEYPHYLAIIITFGTLWGTVESYDYWLVKALDDGRDFKYEKIYRYWNSFRKKEVFDVMKVTREEVTHG